MFALHALVVAVGTWLLFFPTLRSGFRHLQADPGDTVLNHYLLEHSFRWAGGRGELWSPPFFAPAPNALAYSENLLGVAPLYWGLRLLCPPLLAFQLWMMALPALTYASVVACLRRWRVRDGWAAWAGVVVAFSLPRANQIGHQQLLPLMFAPWAVAAVVDLVRRPTRRAWAQLLAATAWQLVASFYLGWFTVFAVGMILVVGTWGAWRRWLAFGRERWAFLLITGVVWLVALAWFFAPYVEANRGFKRPFSECLAHCPAWHARLSAPPPSVWGAVLAAFGDRNPNMERWLFPGLTVVVMAALTLRWSVAKRANVLIVAALAIALLMSRYGNVTPWKLVYKAVPGAQAVRAVARLECVVLLLTAFAVALRFRRNRFGVAVALLALLETSARDWPHFDPAPTYALAHRLAADMRPGQTYYVTFPPDRDPWEYQLVAMWAGLEADAAVANGYSGRAPVGYPPWDRPMTPAQLAAWAGGSPRILTLDVADYLAVPAAARHTEGSRPPPP